MPQPSANENKEEFISRCMGDEEAVNDFPDEAQRFAVCSSKWEESKMTALSKFRKAFAEPQRISFDYDETLTRVMDVAMQYIAKGAEVFIISARSNKEPMLKRAESLGIPESRVYATGSNKEKVEKIKELGIDKHYDNNPDVIKELGSVGQLVVSQAEDSYNDYPDSVRNNARRGIELNKELGNKCATQVGKVRGQQLANKEPISVDTIKRMYSYLSRAEVYYDNAAPEDCGYVSFLLWGGKTGKDWAESKLKGLNLI